MLSARKRSADALHWCATALLLAYALVGPAQDRNGIQVCLDSCASAKDAGDFEKALVQAGKALDLATVSGDSLLIGRALVERSTMLQMKGDYFTALKELYEALRIYERIHEEDGLAAVYNAIGTIHHYDHNYAQARSFYARSLAIRERQGRASDLALLYGNIGSLLEEMGRPDSALVYHLRNLRIRERSGDQRWIGVCLANLGTCHDKLGSLDSARYYLERSVAVLRVHADASVVSQALAMLGHTLLNAGHIGEAVVRCEEGLRMAQAQDALPTKEQCYDCLYKAYSRQGRAREGLRMLELLVAARDSMFGRERAKGLLRIELNYANERQQLADSLKHLEQQHEARIAYEQRLGRERDQKRVFLFSGIGILLLAGGLWNRLRFVRRSRNLIKKERDRSEGLLLNILPAPIADELKKHGRAQAREVDGVSILFTDFHDFTRLSERLSPQELVAEIDACFRAFDAIAAHYLLEKIKTIGDAYMCAGGLPEPREGSTADTILAALAMQTWLRERAAQRLADDRPVFRMRAGIHTGPVVAGIVGESKFQYDIWGDTVNTAARLESAGTVDEVNISEATYRSVKADPRFLFEPRGRVKVKGKGELAMFYVRLRTIDRPRSGSVS
ncbi:MAG: tetratricopeptide repeat protein [Flavobacteriales bacterium]|nr:tetratricopeptide repeat protein [Flavobacteriales bacterium]MCB9194181.1 tetratricopeptide repeat protein [Flavobacteriales bacterium]